MIERKFVAEKFNEYQIREYISHTLKNAGHSTTKLIKTPLGEKIVIYASRPGLVVGRKGENIKKLTNTLKKKFHLENPQIEIAEVEDPLLDANIVAERIASTIERFGIQKFKAIGHKTMQDVMNAGALGIEIRLSGKIPSSRAKSWRFYVGYLKKCGDIAIEGVKRAHASAQLKSGTIGIKVRIMPPDIKLPDDIELTQNSLQEEPIKKEVTEKTEISKETKEEKPKRTRKKKETKEEKVEEKNEV